MLVAVAVCWLLFNRWHEIPLPLQKGVAIFGVLIALFWFFGNTGEYRVFLDIYPALTTIAGYTLFRPLEKPTPPKTP